MKKMFMLFMVTYLLLTMSISAQNRENSFTRAPLVSTAIREGKQRNVISTQNERIRSFTSGATRATVSSYNFNNGMPSGFQLRNPNSYYNWEVGMNGSSSAFEIPPSPDGTAYAYINDDAANDDLSDVWMILPVMDFSTLTSPRLEFENFRVSLGDIFTIKISTTGTTWTNLITYPTDEELEAWQTEEISLTSYAGQSTVYIAFHYNDDDDWLYGWAIDNIRVFQPEEDDLAITNVTPSLTVPGDAVIPTVTVTNRGLNSASVWSINLTDGDSYNSTVTGIELAPGASTTVNMDAWSPAAGTYTLIATLSFTEDDDLQNNTMTITTRVSPFQGDAFTGNTTERSYNIVNISNGSTTEIGTIERSPFPMAEEFDGTTVYRIYEDNTIGFVNTEGIYSQLGNITGISGSVMSISYDWDVEQMYLLAVDDYNYSLLYTLDMNTYVATLVGTSSSPSMIIAIDLAYDGYFYGPGIADDMLHKISKTGVFTPVGALGVNINYGQDVSYNHNDGRLYTYTCGDYITRAYGYYDLSTGAFVPITHSGDNQYATLVMMPEHLPLCDTISNLTATVDDNNDVTLTWTAPATMPAGYEIYSNGTLLTTVTTTVYTHASVANGIYYYSVKPLFESNCFLSENNIEVTVGDVCQLTFDMYDDALDGWDGGSRIDIVQYGNVINSVTCIDDYHSTETIAVAGEVDFVWVSLSNYDYECSFTISYEGEEIYASSGTPTAGTFFTWACVRSCESVINLTAESDDNNVTLTWTAPATTPTGYEIYFNGTLLTTVTTTTYTHTAVADGVHTYTVKALFEGEDCEPTGVNVEITIGDVCQLTFNMFDSDNDSWNDGSRIDIVQDGNAIASITHTGGSSSTETVVVAGEVDFVWVSLGNYDYECSFTISYEGEEIYASSGTPTAGTFFTWTCGIPCESVTNLTAEDNDNNVTLSWTAPTTTPTGYEIYFNGTLLTTVTTTTYTHTAVADGIYTYMVKALFDGEDCVPIGVSTEITVGDICQLTFDMYDSSEDGWDGGSRIDIVQDGVVINSVTCIDGDYSTETILVAGVVDFVWVSLGDYDNECSFTIFYGGEQIYASSGTPTAGTFFTWTCGTPCESVTNLTAEDNDNNVTLSWTAPTTTPTGYEIYFNGTLLTTVTTTTYTHTAVADGIYTYMVKALFDGEDCVPIGVSTEITVGDICSVTINMFGDYDDSWTWGSYINIVQNSVVIATVTLPEGNYSGSRTIIIPGGETQFVWVEGGYDDECSFTISFGGEQIYASSGTPTAGTFFTWACISDCDDVTNLEGVADARNITLSWDPASSNVTSWEIEFKPVGSTTFYTRTSDIPEDFISGVSENTEYLIRVRAICYGFSGEWDTIYVRTQSENTFTLTGIATPSNGGTVNPPLVTVSANSSQQFNFAANISWTIDSVTVNGNRVEYTPGTGNTGTYNISNIMQDYTVEVFFKNHSGITENDYDKIKLYPNPAHNAINIETQSLYKKVEIVNVIGEVIYSENIENLKFNLDISDMVSGLYIVRLHGDQGVATRKFVKE